jgi:FMNH2-dependent dimethyl sulfone monooxygenase
VRTIINSHVICHPTEMDARAPYQSILDHEDPLVAENFVHAFASGDQSSWRGHRRTQWVIGGNVQLVGTPEQIVAWFTKLHAAGCDGVQVTSSTTCPTWSISGRKSYR